MAYLLYLFAFFMVNLHGINDPQNSNHHNKPQQVSIIGSGYVGLVAGAGLAEIGHNVVCIDSDHEKITKLQQGIIPIYEPDLQELIIKHLHSHKLSFSTNSEQSIKDAEIIIITVGTPIDHNDQVDISALNNVIMTIGKNLASYKIICIKSTVPIGTCQDAQVTLQKLCGHHNFAVVSNPEFLREGSALYDFFEKNPIVLGSDSEYALNIMEELYKPLIADGRTLIKTNFATSEAIKYAWNAFSTIKIAYTNELSHLCNTVGADIFTLMLGVSFSEKLLPIGTVKPGPGIGGSCLPKDTKAFVSFAKKHNLDFDIVQSAINANSNHTQKILNSLYALLDNTVAQKTVAILGLAFKPNTDDIRSSPAIYAIKKLLCDGAIVKAYDPYAQKNMQILIPEALYCSSVNQAIKDADALILITDWEEFKTIDLQTIANLMKQKIIIDTRNMWNPQDLNRHGFTYHNLGRIN